MFFDKPIIIIISNISTMLPFIFGTAFLWHVKQRKSFFPIWGFFTFDAAMEVVFLIYSLQGKPNAWIIHFYTPLEYSILAYILSTWQEKKQISNFIKISIPVYLISYTLLKIYEIEIFDAETINYISRPLTMIIISILSLYTIHQVWSKYEGELFKNSIFWFLVSILIYYTGSIIVEAFFYLKNRDVLWHLLYSRNTLNILRNILFTAGIIVAYIYKSNPEEEVAAV